MTTSLAIPLGIVLQEGIALWQETERGQTVSASDHDSASALTARATRLLHAAKACASALGIQSRDAHTIHRSRAVSEPVSDTRRGSTPQGDAVFVPLTPREVEVLRLIADGRSDREIAGRLTISHRTAQCHALHIRNKLGVESRTAAATYAVRHGLV